MQNAQTNNEPKLNRNIQRRIGYELREMYSALASEPIPDRLLCLLVELEDEGPRKRAA